MQTSDISGLETAATDAVDGPLNDLAVQFVAFSVGAQNFCIDIMQVREIRAWSGATALPNAPEFVRGVINLRGHIVGNDEDDGGSGSIAYVPPEPEDDLQLQYAKDLIKGVKQHAAYPPDPDKAVPTPN